MLQGWTNSILISPQEYDNEFVVTADGSFLEFSIIPYNQKEPQRLWSGYNDLLTTGAVGVGMYAGSGTSTDRLWVDEVEAWDYGF
jgi:hypothetical protein